MFLSSTLSTNGLSKLVASKTKTLRNKSWLKKKNDNKNSRFENVLVNEDIQPEFKTKKQKITRLSASSNLKWIRKTLTILVLFFQRECVCVCVRVSGKNVGRLENVVMLTTRSSQSE